jgi:S-adenosylmethionine decarboxylase proenzyme
LLKASGRHLLTECYGCDQALLNDVDQVRRTMESAAVQCGAAIVAVVFHSFSPRGVSGVVIIAKSHFAIHTWPEYGYAAVDLFACADDVDLSVASEYLKKELKARFASTREMNQGELDILGRQASHKPYANPTGISPRMMENTRDH